MSSVVCAKGCHLEAESVSPVAGQEVSGFYCLFLKQSTFSGSQGLVRVGKLDHAILQHMEGFSVGHF